jgi:5-oxoprolinase (ATP-hydrolysing) subunit A
LICGEHGARSAGTTIGTVAAVARTIDLNADVGESFGRWRLGDDDALLPWITSANVACGFHAGDARTIRMTVERCAEHGVVIGAQVSYRDLAGFGRRAMDIEPADLEADVLYQVAAVDGLARVAGAGVRYLKPHGALYHRTLVDEEQAAAVVAAVVAWDPAMPVMTMEGGALAQRAEVAGLRVVREGFADRVYGADGRLVPRTQPGALLAGAAQAADQAARLAASGRYESLCVHGDTPGAAAIAEAVRHRLARDGVTVAAFAMP